jgi:hypothetical protein
MAALPQKPTASCRFPALFALPKLFFKSKHIFKWDIPWKMNHLQSKAHKAQAIRRSKLKAFVKP